MKKFLIICLVLFLVGCSSEEEFSKKCNYEVKSKHVNSLENYDAVYNNYDELLYVTYTKTYKALDEEGKRAILAIDESSLDYNKKYAGNKCMKITSPKTDDDEYIVKYSIDVKKCDDDILDEFSLKKNSIKFFNKMKSNGYECK